MKLVSKAYTGSGSKSMQSEQEKTGTPVNKTTGAYKYHNTTNFQRKTFNLGDVSIEKSGRTSIDPVKYFNNEN